MSSHYLLMGNHRCTNERCVPYDLQHQTSPISVVYSGHRRPRGVHINVQLGGGQLLAEETPFSENNSVTTLLPHNNSGLKRDLRVSGKSKRATVCFVFSSITMA